MKGANEEGCQKERSLTRRLILIFVIISQEYDILHLASFRLESQRWLHDAYTFALTAVGDTNLGLGPSSDSSPKRKTDILGF